MKLNSIQFLRAVAALLVVYEHSMDIQEWFGISKQQKFYYLDNFGCIGVDLFFVISGFIITYVASKYIGSTQGLHFLAKRFYRINPVYYLATLFYLSVYIITLKLLNQPFTDALKQIEASLSDSILIFPTTNNIDSFKPLLIVGWTLSYEWLFYILFFVLILFKVTRKGTLLSIIIFLLVITGQLLKPDDFRFIFLTNPIMLEFTLGVIICNVYLKFYRISARIGMSFLLFGIACYMAMIIYGYGNIYHYLEVLNGHLSLRRFLLWGIPSGFIVIGCVILEKKGWLSRLWNNRLVLLCGDASYSIYLIHYIILRLLMLLYPKTGYFLPADLMIWFQFIIAFAASLAFYKLIEKPLLKYINNSSTWSINGTQKNKTPINESNNYIKPLTR